VSQGLIADADKEKVQQQLKMLLVSAPRFAASDAGKAPSTITEATPIEPPQPVAAPAPTPAVVPQSTTTTTKPTPRDRSNSSAATKAIMDSLQGTVVDTTELEKIRQQIDASNQVAQKAPQPEALEVVLQNIKVLPHSPNVAYQPQTLLEQDPNLDRQKIFDSLQL